MNLNRFSLNNIGIFVELDSPIKEPRPEASRLPKVGPENLGAISFFTPKSLLRYNQEDKLK
jgi:hypothetical protein